MALWSQRQLRDKADAIGAAADVVHDGPSSVSLRCKPPKGSMPRMPQTRVVVLTVLAMLAFAANSLLCRLALRSTPIDPATFTAIRLVSGASVLALIVAIRCRARLGGNWWSALALFVYAAGFSLAYVGL